MDEQLLKLRRDALASQDLESLSRYFWLLKTSGLKTNLEYLLELRNFLIDTFPAEFNDIDEVSIELATTPLVNLARDVSSFIFNGRYNYFRNKFMEPFDYENPPTGSSTWAVVEFLETGYINPARAVRNRLVAMTGVYLVNTGMIWHLCSFEGSSRLMELYPNFIDVVRQDFSDLESEWFSFFDENYTNRRNLRNAINWHWIPQEQVLEIDYVEDLSPEEREEEIENNLREYYQGNHVL